MVRVNHTTPSKSGSPRVSHAPGSCMSFHSAAMSLAFGVRQSGFRAPSRRATGSASNGSAALSALYAAVKAVLCRLAAMKNARLSHLSPKFSGFWLSR